MEFGGGGSGTGLPIEIMHSDRAARVRGIELFDGSREDLRNEIIVRRSWDLAALIQLRSDLTAEYPRTQTLIDCVDAQIVRCQLRAMMGGSITTRANVFIDDKLQFTSKTRDVKLVTVSDDELGKDGGSPRTVQLWNRSLKDAEVATIHDVISWARTVEPSWIIARKKVVIEVVGVSGPCEACQRRLAVMAETVLGIWARGSGGSVPLPLLEVRSYYGNPSKGFDRGSYVVRNGWADDGTPANLSFTNRAGWHQPVREHDLGSWGGPPPLYPPDTPFDPSQFEVRLSQL
jgi:hypothetical protein